MTVLESAGEDPLDRRPRRAGARRARPRCRARCGTSRCDDVLRRRRCGATSTSTSAQRPARRPSTTPMPHRVSPGSIPSTRMPSLAVSSEHLFARHASRRRRRDGVRHAAVARVASDRLDRGASGVELGQHLVGDVEVGEDVLHVVEVLERVDEAEHLAGARRRRPGCPCSRTNCDLGGVVVDPDVLQRACARRPRRSPRRPPRRTRRGR